MILLIQCSDLKNPGKGPARDIYAGPLTLLSIKYAELKGLKPLILSGKYGIITPDTIIESYDLRIKVYPGPWPKEDGLYVGGKEYFRLVPPHIKRLFPVGMSYCQMKSHLNMEVNPHRYGRVR